TTSPQIGWGHKESLSQGDSHYWGVWWGNEPFETYEKKVGRFMSEYGFQSLPDLNSFKMFVSANQLNLNSDEIKSHQKHPTGFKTIETYMERDFIVPKDLEKYIYVSQLTQARGVQIAIESHRRARPNCMGTLFWQMNDCWPVTSWSAIDYYKRPKAFYYDLKRLYDNVLISIIKSDIYYECHILNDNLNEIKGKIELTVKDFFGKT
ncbi:MAG TPA: glycoside hydrolase family 2 protein, partial [Bacteroidia bacterium]|nr:glycoside hydrolase family 2 protein [Bacteroidia bacterium]